MQVYRFILVVINCFSKYLWSEPVKNKSERKIGDAIKRILSRSKQFVPRNLQTYQGTEFYNTQFSKLITMYGINHDNTYSTKNSPTTEWVIRTQEEDKGNKKAKINWTWSSEYKAIHLK